MYKQEENRQQHTGVCYQAIAYQWQGGSTRVKDPSSFSRHRMCLCEVVTGSMQCAVLQTVSATSSGTSVVTCSCDSRTLESSRHTTCPESAQQRGFTPDHFDHKRSMSRRRQQQQQRLLPMQPLTSGSPSRHGLRPCFRFQTGSFSAMSFCMHTPCGGRKP